jgi:hypothetical protein
VNAYLEIKNTTNANIVVNPTLYPSGLGAVAMPAMNLKPHETDYYDLLSFEALLGGKEYGGADIASSGGPGSVVANITTQNETSGHSFDSLFVDPALDGSKVLHSPCWMSAKSTGWNAYLEMKNTTSAQVSVYPRLYPAGGGGVMLAELQIGPNQTRYVDLWSVPGLEEAGSGGAEILHNGPLGAVTGNITNLNYRSGESFDSPFWAR